MSNVAPVPSDPSFLALQAAVAGRFSLEGEVGRGGMGIVYLARDVLLERPVAIKLLAPTLACRSEMRRRFLREARLAAQCFHPHIVPIHEVAEDGELAWFVMGYVQGETLADRLRRAGTLSAEAIRRIGREIGWALAYAHERGVVHRDVKPENILLEQGTDRALIADFGIAVATRSDGIHTSADDVAGTRRFMAPEQAMGELVDGRADLYALGVTLHLAATGRHPYNDVGGLALVAQRDTLPAPSVARVAPRLPASLADAIDQCLALRPEDRYDSAAAFVAALERSPEGAELPVDARAVRVGASATMTLADWTVAIAYAGFFLVLGEESRSFGRAIMEGIAYSVITFAGVATLLRGGETLLAARRALGLGVAPDDVAAALAPPPEAPISRVGPVKAMAMLMAGSLLALAQGKVDEQQLPVAIELFANVITWLAPPILIHRALTGARYTSGFSGWLFGVVRKPLAERVVRWLGGKRTEAAPRVAPADAPTEVLLGRAADEIFARLPEAARRELPQLPATALALAGEAVRLRVRIHDLSGALRAHRLDRVADQTAVAAVQAEHVAAQGRLGTTVAALESIRLELLRLEAGQSLPGSLTEQLDAVREIQRRVDADHEVRRLLHGEPTPA